MKTELDPVAVRLPSMADTDSAPLPCTLCAETFSKPSVLALHVKQHQYAYQCRYCARKIKTERELLRHEATHSGDQRILKHVELPPKPATPAPETDSVTTPDTPKIVVPKEENDPLKAVTISKVKVKDLSKLKEANPNREPPRLDKEPAPKSQLTLAPAAKPAQAPAPKPYHAPKAVSSLPAVTARVFSDKSVSIKPVKAIQDGDKAPKAKIKHLSISKPPAKKSYSEKPIQEDNIDVSPGQREEVFKKAKEYDEVKQRCDNLEKEIAVLQLEHDSLEEEDTIEMKGEPETQEIKTEPPEEKDDIAPAMETEVDEVEDDDVDWDSDNKTIPPAWKVTKSGLRKKFQSPEGFIFETRVKAIQFMFNSSYPDSLISLMRNHLEEEGWRYDKSCPTGWKARKVAATSGRSRDLEYLSPSMEVIPSMEEMLAHLQANSKDRREILKLEERMGRGSPKPPPEVASPPPSLILPPSPILPPGWTKKVLAGAEVYISPGGEVLHNIHQVLARLASSPGPEKRKADLAPGPAGKRARATPVIEARATPTMEARATPIIEARATPSQDTSSYISRKIPPSLERKIPPSLDRKRSIEDAVAKVRKLAGIEATTNHKIKTTTNEKVEATINNKVEANTNHKFKATTNHRIEAATIFKVKATTNHNVGATTNHKVRATTNHKIEATTNQKVKATTNTKVEATNNQEVKATTNQEAEATTNQNMKATINYKVEATTNQKVEATTNQKVEATTNHKVEATTNQEVEATTNHEIKATTNHTVKATTNHRVEARHLDKTQVATLEDMYQSHPHPKLKKYSDLAEGWNVDKKLIMDWFRQRREAKLNPDKSDGKGPDRPSVRTSGVTVSKSLVKSNSKSLVKSDSKSLVRRTRSFEKVTLTREQRWLMEAAVEKGRKTPQELVSLAKSTGLSEEYIEKWMKENPRSS